jgi:hypothetical protein
MSISASTYGGFSIAAMSKQDELAKSIQHKILSQRNNFASSKFL